jgi:hypothetical protein
MSGPTETDDPADEKTDPQSPTAKLKRPVLDPDAPCRRCGHALRRHAYLPHAGGVDRRCLHGHNGPDGRARPGEAKHCDCQGFLDKLPP